MDRPVAEKIIELVKLSDKTLHQLHLAIDEIGDVDEKKKLRRAWAVVIGEIYKGILVPVLRQYPDLDPDKPKA